MKISLPIKLAVFAVLLIGVGWSYTLYADSLHSVFKDVPASVTIRNIDIGLDLGDCNGDGSVSSADITAIVLEIFDGDGVDPADTPNGTFAGTPNCDANEDGAVGAADITCVVLIIFGGPGSCGPAPLATTGHGPLTGEDQLEADPNSIAYRYWLWPRSAPQLGI